MGFEIIFMILLINCFYLLALISISKRRYKIINVVQLAAYGLVSWDLQFDIDGVILQVVGEAIS